MARHKYSQDEISQYTEKLRELLPPGTKVLTILRHVSRSGMSRNIDLYVPKDGELVYLTGMVAAVCGMNRADSGAIKIEGSGMDMGFHIVYGLSRRLYQGNFSCIGPKCPSNDHNNGDRNYEPHQHSDGGYALKHDWL